MKGGGGIVPVGIASCLASAAIAVKAMAGAYRTTFGYLTFTGYRGSRCGVNIFRRIDAMNIRLLPPVPVSKQTIAINGRGYSAAPGSVVDVLDVDAQELQANGWIPVAPSGPTSARPTGTLGLYSAAAGQTFYDTTIGKLIISDGQSWRDPATGGAV
jgi:hypothetical protein